MKIAIIGGAGTRVPLLTHGLLRFHSDLGPEEISLWDIDPTRRKAIARISRAMAEIFDVPLIISEPRSLDEAVADSCFVISCIRVGGTTGRILDETIALQHGTVGQETVGAGGFALSLRTIPPMIEYARQVSMLAPQAWLVNFTNPVGIISQALIQAGFGDRVIGVCDTPREQFESFAQVLGVPLEEAFFDYFGLNHLGWVRAVVVNGKDRSHEIFESTEKLKRSYKRPLFEPDFLRELEILPTEYLYYYYFPDRAIEKIRESGSTRGKMVQELENRLLSGVLEHDNEPDKMVGAYDDYLARRNATYMAMETGERVADLDVGKAREELYQHAAGYERIAIDVMRAIHGNRATVMPVDVANRGAIAELEDQDAVEVPCVIDATGAHPLAVGKVPKSASSLLMDVKEYERLTVRAALERSAALAEEALRRNPLIRSREQAGNILRDYRASHRPYLDYLG